ncbi:hypothetical protein [Desulfotalea psychrophila]|uniref:hypothetical protein n=1 Tax=Desulfotalea psychrophila TaxID=84980 RepID=UPI0012EA5400|nr:hypothetical protein [Desulfotalea psychrophila]
MEAEKVRDSQKKGSGGNEGENMGGKLDSKRGWSKFYLYISNVCPDKQYLATTQ